jgi:SNF2 family DNA or RNA helicase
MSSLQIHPLNAGLFEIRTSYFSKALNEACKLVPGMRWSLESKNWYGYSDAIEQLQEELLKNNIRLGGELPDVLDWKSRDITTVNLKASNGWVARHYQEDGVRFILDKAEEGCLLADGMRCGKSGQASLAARYLDVKTLIVCPPNAVGVWARPPDDPKPGELAKWWPEAWRGLDDKPYRSNDSGVVVLEGIALAKWQDAFWKISEKKEEKRSAEEKQKLKEADAILSDALKELQNAKVVVIHDQLIYAWVEVLLRWGFEFLVIDEAHAFSSYDTRRSISAKKLAARARYRLATTGTPMTSRPRDLHNVVDLLCPGRFGAFFRHEKQKGTFSDSFCGSFQETVGKGPEAKTVWNHNGKSNVELLHKRLQRMMLRRTAKEVDTELPDKTRQVIDVRVPANKMVMPSMSNLGDRRVLRRVLDLTADAKLRPVQDLLKSHLEEGLKIIAFCHRRVFAETLVSGSVKFGIENLGSTFVHGDISQKERDRRIIKAEKHVGPFLFAATIESCSTAIDLSFADVIVFCELVWVPSEFSQAEERSYKFGDGRKRLIQYVIARGTGDELILRAVISKLADFEAIVGNTGDRMKEDLAGKKDPDAALKRLAAAMEEMHKARPVSDKKKKQGILGT